ncbi:GNAT family N-acetyltransferase [Candidatus Wolfebacteria bacterium]|nr:GNAT family N-acetyltransferase [Candidatus Wolfebacteria bacterium]
MPEITIKENNIKDAVKVLSTIPEFEYSFSEESLKKELKGKKYLIVVGYVDGNPAGCAVSFDRFGDDSLYCWLVGVNPNFRGLGIMALMMEYQEKWAKSNHYKVLRIKTRNDSRSMLKYLIKDNFNIIDVHSPKNFRGNVAKKYYNLVILKVIYILKGLLKLETGESEKNRIMLEKYL